MPQVITYQEPYEYYICTVKLKNKDLSHLPVEVLTEEQLSAYSLYMRTLGNRPDLFGQAQTPVTVDGTTMDVQISNNLDPLTKENMMDMTVITLSTTETIAVSISDNAT